MAAPNIRELVSCTMRNRSRRLHHANGITAFLLHSQEAEDAAVQWAWARLDALPPRPSVEQTIDVIQEAIERFQLPRHFIGRGPDGGLDVTEFFARPAHARPPVWEQARI